MGNPQPELVAFDAVVLCMLRAERIISELDGGRDGAEYDGAVLAVTSEVGGE